MRVTAVGAPPLFMSCTSCDAIWCGVCTGTATQFRLGELGLRVSRTVVPSSCAPTSLALTLRSMVTATAWPDATVKFVPTQRLLRYTQLVGCCPGTSQRRTFRTGPDELPLFRSRARLLALE